MSFKQANEKALSIAKENLADIDISSRCSSLGLPEPVNNQLRFRAFGMNMVLHLSELHLQVENNKTPVKLGDHILVLHYLQYDKKVMPANRLISFKSLSGGQFYWQPFVSRTSKPLISRIGENLDLLKKNLNRFDWEQAELKDFSAKIHVLGNIYITLVYHRTDDEFPPEADILFDASIKDVLVTEDCAYLASRICFGLL